MVVAGLVYVIVPLVVKFGPSSSNNNNNSNNSTSNWWWFEIKMNIWYQFCDAHILKSKVSFN